MTVVLKGSTTIRKRTFVLFLGMSMPRFQMCIAASAVYETHRAVVTAEIDVVRGIISVGSHWVRGENGSGGCTRIETMCGKEDGCQAAAAVLQ